MSLRGGSCVSVHGPRYGVSVITAFAALLSMSVVVNGVSEQNGIAISGSGQMNLESQEDAMPSTDAEKQEAMNQFIGAVKSGMGEEDAGDKKQAVKAHHKAHHKDHHKAKGKGLMRTESSHYKPNLEGGAQMEESGTTPHGLPKEAAIALGHLPKLPKHKHGKDESDEAESDKIEDKTEKSKTGPLGANAVETLEVQDAKAKVAQATKSLQRQEALEAVMKAAQEVALDREKEEVAEEDLRKKAQFLDEVSSGTVAAVPKPVPRIDEKTDLLDVPIPKHAIDEKAEAKDLQAKKLVESQGTAATSAAKSIEKPKVVGRKPAERFRNGVHMSQHTPGQVEHWLKPHRLGLGFDESHETATAPSKDSATSPAQNQEAPATSMHGADKPTPIIHGAPNAAHNLLATQPGILPLTPVAEQSNLDKSRQAVTVVAEQSNLDESRQAVTEEQHQKIEASAKAKFVSEDAAFHENLKSRGLPDTWLESVDGRPSSPGVVAPELMARPHTEAACLTCQCKFMDRHGANSECDSAYPLRVLVAKWLNPKSTVLELGASYGAASCAIAEKQGNSGRLVSVEPDHRIWETLETNRAKNKCNFSTVRGVLGTSSMEAVEGADESMQLLSFGGKKRSEQNTIVQHVSLKQIEARHGMKFDAAVLDCDGCLPKLLDESPEIFDHMQLLVLALHNMTGFDRLRMLPVMRNFTVVQETDNYRVIRHNTGVMSLKTLTDTMQPLEKPKLDFYVGNHGRPNWVLLQKEEEERKKREERK